MEKSTFTRKYAALCAFLRDKRIAAGLTQVELAKKLDETQSYVSKVERGERRLDLVQLAEWCRAIELPLVSFVREFEKICGKL